MKKPNFLKYKFHASQTKKLMTNPRSKKDKLSKTTQSYLQEVWIEEVFGRKKFISSAPMEKGTMVESDSLDLVQKVENNTYFKNQNQFENDYVVGTPDVVKPLIDIKSSWDIWTFMSVDEKLGKKNYYWQLLTYAWLLDEEEANLVYCLVNTPEIIIDNEMNRLSYKIPEPELDEYRKNYIFDDIPPEMRMKKYRFDIDEEDIEKLKKRIIDARE